MKRGIRFLAVLTILVAGGAGGFAMLTGEPNEIRTTLTPAETTVSVGDTFTVEVEIENVDLNAVTINAIALDQSLLDGASVGQMDPMYRSVQERSYPVYGSWTEYTLDHTLLGGEKMTVTLTLRANQSGNFSGNVMVWIDSDVVGLSVGRARRATLNVVVQ